jgi:hypothetical protein
MMKIVDDNGGEAPSDGRGEVIILGGNNLVDMSSNISDLTSEEEDINRNNRFKPLLGFIIRKFAYLIRQFKKEMRAHFQKITRV